MDENDLLDSCSTAPAASLPEGWYWRHYGDGSGGLHSPDGRTAVSYDRQHYANIGWVEYLYGNEWSLFQDGFKEFINFAERLVKTRKGEV